MEKSKLESMIRDAVEDAILDYEVEYGNIEYCGIEVFVDIDESDCMDIDVSVFEK